MPAALHPPSERDFEIHHQALVCHHSTRTIADRYKVSQTRVRQVICRVSQWLAAMLPVKTDVEKEAEARLAQHIAAEQLRHQCQELRAFWDGTGDPKYQRQLTRVSLALARLGIVPGTLDCLEADADCSRQTPSAVEALDEFSASGTRTVPATDPPVAACSADSVSDVSDQPSATEPVVASHFEQPASHDSAAEDEATYRGLSIMENRLLTLIQQATKEQDRQQLEEGLANVRRAKANLEIRISPEQIGAAISPIVPVTPQRVTSHQH